MIEAELGLSADPRVDERVSCPPAAVAVGGSDGGINLGCSCANRNLMIEIYHEETPANV